MDYLRYVYLLVFTLLFISCNKKITKESCLDNQYIGNIIQVINFQKELQHNIDTIKLGKYPIYSNFNNPIETYNITSFKFDENLLQIFLYDNQFPMDGFLSSWDWSLKIENHKFNITEFEFISLERRTGIGKINECGLSRVNINNKVHNMTEFNHELTLDINSL